MSKTQTKTLIFYQGDPNDDASTRGIATISAAKIVVVSQYADLKDANDKLVATLTWTGDVKVREI